MLGRFRLGYGRVGPTEARIVLIGLTAALALSREVPRSAWSTLASVGNVVAAFLGAVLLALLVARFARNVHILARLEPQFKREA